MTVSPKKVDINVTLNSATPGDFTIEPSPLGSLPTGSNGELIFENNNHPGFHIHFHLKDPNGLGYRFPPNSKNKAAVWSQLGAGACPDEEMWEVFDPIRVDMPDRMTLVVHNPNPKVNDGGQGLFGYTLRVTKTNGAPYLPLDPGGDNRNGPVTRLNMQQVLVFIGGAVVGSLVTLGGQALIQG